jgi:hypothetical protein
MTSAKHREAEIEKARRCGGIRARPTRGRNELVWMHRRVSREGWVATLGLCLKRFLCRLALADNFEAMLYCHRMASMC